MSVVALVLAAGQGSRLEADVPKALVRLGARSLLERSAAALARARQVDAVLAVLPPDSGSAAEALRAGWVGPARLLEPIVGGATRQESVALGLAAARAQRPDMEWVLVHDAARAFVSPSDAEAVLACARSTGAAVPVIPVTDTLKRLGDGCVVETPDRRHFGRAQTPQAFRAELLAEALAKAVREQTVATDCSALVERLGVRVRTCVGRAENFKLTEPRDLLLARALLEHEGAL